MLSLAVLLIGITDKQVKRPSVTRGLSRISVKSEDDIKDEEIQTVVEEERAKGSLKWAVISSYIRAVNSVWAVILALFALVLTQASATAADYWLSYWYENINCIFSINTNPFPFKNILNNNIKRLNDE